MITPAIRLFMPLPPGLLAWLDSWQGWAKLWLHMSKRDDILIWVVQRYVM